MKIEQKRTFIPITITLESEFEVDSLWMAIDGYVNQYVKNEVINKDKLNILNDISNWFRDKACR